MRPRAPPRSSSPVNGHFVSGESFKASWCKMLISDLKAVLGYKCEQVDLAARHAEL